MLIYDTWREDLDDAQFNELLKKKLETYVNYILSGGMIDYFSLRKEKKYQYIIQIVSDCGDKWSEERIRCLNEYNAQIVDYTGGMVRLA